MNKWIRLAVVICIFGTLAACAPTPTPDLSLQLSSTASMKTVSALNTLLADRPTATRTQTPIPATATATITPTRFLSSTPLPTVATPWNTCNSAKFITETIGDQIVMEPGAAFVKSWTLQNSGECVWDQDYRLVFESGEAMTGNLELAFLTDKQTVQPGQEVTITINLTTPAKPGEYVGFWKLANADGQRFGLTGAADPIWVHLVVGAPNNDLFKVTSAKAGAAPNSHTGSCGKGGVTVTLVGTIKTNKAGTVSYYWTGSDIKTQTQTIQFYGADTQQVFVTFTITKGIHHGFAKLMIVSPNELSSEKATYSIECIQ